MEAAIVKEDPIDPERLAAFLDGTLTETERDEVLRQLARSRRAFETLAGAAAILSEIDEGTKAARRRSWLRPVPGSSRWLVQRAAFVAVPTLVAAAVAAVLLLSDGSIRSTGAVALAGAILPELRGNARPQLPAEWYEAGWSPARSETGILDDDARAFRLGARLMALELAWQHGAADADAIRADVVGMLSRLEGATLMAARYRDLSATSSENDRRAAAADVRRILLGSPWFDLGVWTQAARIATAARNPQFFDTRRARRLLAAVVVDMEAERAAGRPAPAALGRVVDLTQDGVQPAEWLDLRSALDLVIQESAE